jgi:hypothetical protein
MNTNSNNNRREKNWQRELWQAVGGGKMNLKKPSLKRKFKKIGTG